MTRKEDGCEEGLYFNQAIGYCKDCSLLCDGGGANPRLCELRCPEIFYETEPPQTTTESTNETIAAVTLGQEHMLNPILVTTVILLSVLCIGGVLLGLKSRIIESIRKRRTKQQIISDEEQPMTNGSVDPTAAVEVQRSTKANNELAQPSTPPTVPDETSPPRKTNTASQPEDHSSGETIVQQQKSQQIVPSVKCTKNNVGSQSCPEKVGESGEHVLPLTPRVVLVGDRMNRISYGGSTSGGISFPELSMPSSVYDFWSSGEPARCHQSCKNKSANQQTINYIPLQRNRQECGAGCSYPVACSEEGIPQSGRHKIVTHKGSMPLLPQNAACNMDSPEMGSGTVSP